MFEFLLFCPGGLPFCFYLGASSFFLLMFFCVVCLCLCWFVGASLHLLVSSWCEWGCVFLFDWMSLVYVGVVRRGVSLVVFVMIPFVGLFFCFSGVCVFRRVGICFVCVGALRGLFILAVVLWFWFDRPVFFASGFALADFGVVFVS